MLFNSLTALGKKLFFSWFVCECTDLNHLPQGDSSKKWCAGRVSQIIFEALLLRMFFSINREELKEPLLGYPCSALCVNVGT